MQVLFNYIRYSTEGYPWQCRFTSVNTTSGRNSRNYKITRKDQTCPKSFICQHLMYHLVSGRHIKWIFFSQQGDQKQFSDPQCSISYFTDEAMSAEPVNYNLHENLQVYKLGPLLPASLVRCGPVSVKSMKLSDVHCGQYLLGQMAGHLRTE